MAYKRILVPVDGSPTSSRGLREAIGFARAQKARLQLVHVVDVHNAVLAGLEGAAAVTDLAAALKARGRKILANAATAARKAGLAFAFALRKEAITQRKTQKAAGNLATTTLAKFWLTVELKCHSLVNLLREHSKVTQEAQ